MLLLSGEVMVGGIDTEKLSGNTLTKKLESLHELTPKDWETKGWRCTVSTPGTVIAIPAGHLVVTKFTGKAPAAVAATEARAAAAAEEASS